MQQKELKQNSELQDTKWGEGCQFIIIVSIQIFTENKKNHEENAVDIAVGRTGNLMGTDFRDVSYKCERNSLSYVPLLF